METTGRKSQNVREKSRKETMPTRKEKKSSGKESRSGLDQLESICGALPGSPSVEGKDILDAAFFFGPEKGEKKKRKDWGAVKEVFLSAESGG